MSIFRKAKKAPSERGKDWLPTYFKPFLDRPAPEEPTIVQLPFGGGRTFKMAQTDPHDPHPLEDITEYSNYWANLTYREAQNNPGNWAQSLPSTRRNYRHTRNLKNMSKLDYWVTYFTKLPKSPDFTVSYGPMYTPVGDMWGMLHNPRLTGEHLLKLARGNNEKIHQLIATDTRLPAEGVKQLLLVGSRVRELVARRDDLTPEQQIELLNDYSTEVRNTIQLNPSVPDEIRVIAALRGDDRSGDIDGLFS